MKHLLYSIFEMEYTDRNVLFLFSIIMAALVVDVSISQVSDQPLVVDYSKSFWGVMIFTLIMGIYMFGSYKMLDLINRRNKEVGIKSLQDNTLFKVVKVLTYLLLLVTLIIVLQIIFTDQYYKPLLAGCATLSLRIGNIRYGIPCL